MAIPVESNLDFNNVTRIVNAPQAVAAGQLVEFSQLQGVIDGLAWKDDVKTTGGAANVNLAAPGAALGGYTFIAPGVDRFLARVQTTTTECGIYVWNGAAAAATRASDMNASAEFNSAIVPVAEGTEAGTQWRQTAANPVVGTAPIVFVSNGTNAPAASETTAGIAEIATQAEVTTGTDDLRIVTPLKLATAYKKPFSATVGDAAATAIVVTHNLGTQDVDVTVREATGGLRNVIVEWTPTSINAVTVTFAAAPALNSRRVTVSML
jgi:hypothetical protein